MSTATTAHPPDAHRAASDEPDEEYAALLKRLEAFGYHKPDPVPPDQAWFWTKEWLAGMLESEEDRRDGPVRFHNSDEEFIASLEERAKRADAQRG